MASPDGSPVVGWEAPEEPAGLSVAVVGREGWRRARAHLDTYLLIAAVPIALLDLLSAPLWVSFARMIDALVAFWTTLDLDRYRADPDALERDIRAVMRPSSDLAVVGSIGAGVGFTLSILALALLTAAMLRGAGGTPSFGRAVRDVLDHPGAIVVPAVVLGLGYIVILVPISLSTDVLAGPGSGLGSAALGSLVGLVSLVIEALVLYLAVRWSLYFQAVLDEGHGLTGALARSSALTEGIRIRIAILLIAWVLVIGVLIGFPAGLLGLLAGATFGSVAAGATAYVIAISIGAVIGFPWFVGMLTYVYELRVGETGPAPTVSG